MATVRQGKVTDINESTRKVRVFFLEDNFVSDWIKVVQNPPFIPSKDVEQRTEETSGGGYYESFASHSHRVNISPWMPSINDIVLCIYDDGFNGNGYVLGAL